MRSETKSKDNKNGLAFLNTSQFSILTLNPYGDAKLHVTLHRCPLQGSVTIAPPLNTFIGGNVGEPALPSVAQDLKMTRILGL